MASSRLPDSVVVPFDQGVYALTNLLPLIPLARVLDAKEFGQVALGQSLVVGGVVLARAYLATPLLADESEIQPATPRFAQLARRGLAAGVITAALLVLVSAVGVFPLPSPLTMLLLSLGMPAAFVVDIFRVSNIRMKRSLRALFADSVWLTVELVLIAVLLCVPGVGEVAAILMWSAGSMGALLFAFITSGSLLTNAAAGSDPRLSELGRGFLAEAALLVLRVQGYFVALASIAGAETLGGVRFAFAIVAPVNTALAGWRTFSTARFRELDGPQRMSIGSFVYPLCFGLVFVLAVVVIPGSLWDLVSGNTDPKPFLLAISISIALSAFDIMAQAWLASNGQTQWLWKARFVEVAAWLGALLVLRPTSSEVVSNHVVFAAIIGSLAWGITLILSGRDGSVSTSSFVQHSARKPL